MRKAKQEIYLAFHSSSSWGYTLVQGVFNEGILYYLWKIQGYICAAFPFWIGWSLFYLRRHPSVIFFPNWICRCVSKVYLVVNAGIGMTSSQRLSNTLLKLFFSGCVSLLLYDIFNSKWKWPFSFSLCCILVHGYMFLYTLGCTHRKSTIVLYHIGEHFMTGNNYYFMCVCG